LQLSNGLLDKIIRQMIEPLGHSQTHGRAHNPPSLSGQALASLAQNLQPRVGHQRLLTSRSLQGMRNQQRKALVTSAEIQGVSLWNIPVSFRAICKTLPDVAWDASAKE